ncbi:Halogenase OS=Streptomyces tendae OX=1932 GN=GUR47_29950 PE=3 SV=1 [Streptomyces tendae]
MFDQSRDAVLAYREGELTKEQTIARIYEVLGESGLVPSVWGTLDPDNRCPSGVFTLSAADEDPAVGQVPLAPDARGSYFTGGARLVGKEAVQAYTSELRAGSSLVHQTVRDMWLNWNRDWARRPAPRK